MSLQNKSVFYSEISPQKPGFNHEKVCAGFVTTVTSGQTFLQNLPLLFSIVFLSNVSGSYLSSTPQLSTQNRKLKPTLWYYTALESEICTAELQSKQRNCWYLTKLCPRVSVSWKISINLPIVTSSSGNSTYLIARCPRVLSEYLELETRSN